MTDIKLPEPAAGYGRGCNIELADGQPLYTIEQVRDYARACVEASLSAKPQKGAVTDEQIQELWNAACTGSPSEPGWSRHLRFARDVIALAGQQGGA